MKFKILAQRLKFKKFISKRKRNFIDSSSASRAERAEGTLAVYRLAAGEYKILSSKFSLNVALEALYFGYGVKFYCLSLTQIELRRNINARFQSSKFRKFTPLKPVLKLLV